MAQKDFLSQFSSENKPDSFKEEERVKVVKEKKPLNPLFIVIPVLVLLIALGLVYLFLLRPNIEVENFVGQKQSDATAWIKQQEIETTGIIFKEEYNFDNDSGIIIEQDPFEGKVTKKAKMTFVVSKGADPNEKIGVPSLIDMSREEIDKWIKNNKLTQTKINTTYDDTVEKDKVIKVDFAGCDEDTFTRGCSLKISISKGAKPEDEIEMVNYIGKTYAEFETWATSKKLKLTKSEAYSDYYEIGIVTYQSAKEKEKVKAGDTINVTVSKGKAVKMIDMTNWKKQDVIDWFMDNSLSTPNFDEEYSNYGFNRVIDFDVEVGAVLNDVKRVTFTASLGNVISTFIPGKTRDSLQNAINVENHKGANLSIDTDNISEVYSYDHKAGTILSIECKSGDKKYDPIENIPTNAKFTITVSKGKIYVLTFISEDMPVNGLIEKTGTKFDVVELSDYLNSIGIPFSIVANNPVNEDAECHLNVDGVQIAINNTVEIIEGSKVELLVVE